MPSKPLERPRPPRLADDLTPATEPLGDDVSWSENAAGSAAVVNATATNCEVVASRLQGVRFTGCELHRVRIIDTLLQDCELSGAILEEATLVRVQFVRCRLSGLVGAGVKAQDVSFLDCKIDGANFRMSSWDRGAWADSALNDADFYSATLASCGFRRCDLTGVEVSKAVCDGLMLRGSVLDGIKGAASLRNCVIGSDQVVPLALALFGSLGIRVDDEADD